MTKNECWDDACALPFNHRSCCHTDETYVSGTPPPDPVTGCHYDFEVILPDGSLGTVECDQLIAALELPFRVASAFKYLIRSAHGKPGEPRERDLKKAINMLYREVTGRWSEFGKAEPTKESK